MRQDSFQRFRRKTASLSTRKSSTTGSFKRSIKRRPRDGAVDVSCRIGFQQSHVTAYPFASAPTVIMPTPNVERAAALKPQRGPAAAANPDVVVPHAAAAAVAVPPADAPAPAPAPAAPAAALPAAPAVVPAAAVPAAADPPERPAAAAGAAVPPVIRRTTESTSRMNAATMITDRGERRARTILGDLLRLEKTAATLEEKSQSNPCGNLSWP
eukprot:TRINITY_DN668_c3_g1_i1.p2 TRINITY_DN668_c3_g1~~TRINITY_DN668_c3_g1_i1.p2  ORF type:complete len:213 (+),score=27.49 TRINITY_DN668_c3_g1_i1:125-763(+)